jgi:hypothetical protein
MDFIRKNRITQFLAIALALWIPAVSMTGCVTGGYKWTIGFSKWIHSKGTFLRIVLYLLLGWVVGILTTGDIFFNNLIDFWSGKVTTGSLDHKFEKDGNTIYVHNERTPLRKSTFDIYKSDGTFEKIIMQENEDGQVTASRNGILILNANLSGNLANFKFFDSLSSKTSEVSAVLNDQNEATVLTSLKEKAMDMNLIHTAFDPKSAAITASH